MQNVDISGREIDIRGQGSNQFNRFSKVAGPKDRQRHPKHNEKDQSSQINKRDDELASLANILSGSGDLYDRVDVIKEKCQHQHPIYSQQSRCPVINSFEFMVIVVDLKTPEKHSEYSHHVRKVDNVRNGEQHVFHVENEEDFIGAQLKILAELEKGLELGHQIVGDE